MNPRNFYTTDTTLHEILRNGLQPDMFSYAHKSLTNFGAVVANEIDERARHTDREGEPRLVKFDRYGENVSEVWVNEGYKKTVKETYETGIVGYVHKEIPEVGRKGNYLYSFAQGYVLSQSEAGFYCPVTLTMATAFLLEQYANDELKSRFLPHVTATGDDDLFEGATFLTERQGGSDVGANVVKAVSDGEHFKLFGEKYFASNVGMAGVAMVLARIEGAPEGSRGLTLFAVPWRREDGSLNGVSIRRLKDKLGVRAVPSGEIEFEGAIAYVVGDKANGLKYMMEALNLSRICNAVASLGIMRRALNEASDYAHQRDAFGHKLIAFPMVQDTLGKLTAKMEVELATVFDLITLYDRVATKEVSEEELILNRLFIAIMKKESAEQAIHFSHEAIEMHGGNGYIEDFVTPRLLRDAQVLTVWEGTANILGLEFVRLVRKFNAHTLFISTMKLRIEKISKSSLKPIVAKVLDELQIDLNIFASLEEDMQKFEAKAMTQRMAVVYESVIALEMAEVSGEHLALLCDIYLEMTWGLRKIGEPMKTCQLFK
ncbi:acyl-CoA dehydrogenase family protein [Paenisporosarcina antarctica]|uniref:Isovaleryl-CoA dehydrogenase n=1 Tax=Paenisporosarcina antarctica TaxID=417367 RepID=A0A4P7A0A3_9BACL|nr:acyl-CoA dehydrogenase family protein [Paenisporosarcina antarctica]QBP41809.1 isovaleryl-CoA dehydrogenase [Paenisporosarcina antarctica]